MDKYRLQEKRLIIVCIVLSVLMFIAVLRLFLR